jgi:lysophospholipase L1-like esterase
MPCLKNWAKRENYRTLNAQLERFCQDHDYLEFADVWAAMDDADGLVFHDIWIADGDHMNAKGYAIWTKVISNFLPQ